MRYPVPSDWASLKLAGETRILRVLVSLSLLIRTLIPSWGSTFMTSLSPVTSPRPTSKYYHIRGFGFIKFDDLEQREASTIVKILKIVLNFTTVCTYSEKEICSSFISQKNVS